ncbi:MAG: hypothetical protein KatS3mg032_1292 [Cyclobacteriaceae bacterium]|nr:MAG: hypothetical protein KatS3mg032_1292 [Cyclobacteriaceae bacterium]
MQTSADEPNAVKESYPLRKMKSIVRRTERQVRLVFWIWMATIALTLLGIVWYYVL